MPLELRSRKLRNYKPGKKFIPISVTGRACALNCAHCSRHYLEHMRDPHRDGGLENLIQHLVEDYNINGILISGGLNTEYKVPINWKVIRKIKENYDIAINAHVGIITERDEVEEIASSGVDIISVDYVPNDEVIRKVYGANFQESTYVRMIDLFEEYGVKYAPHITVGLNWGKISWEYRAIDTLAERKSFRVLVINVLIPTKGTPMENVKINPDEVIKVFEYARSRIHNKEISLGCMRPREIKYEIGAIDLGFDRIVLASKRALDHATSRGIKVSELEYCCVFPS